MFFFHKTLLLPSIECLCRLLQHEITELPHLPYLLYGNRFALKHTSYQENEHSIRIWKTSSFLDWWYDDFCTGTIIGAMDYTFQSNQVKIEYMNIFDSGVSFLHPKEQMDVYHAMIVFVKRMAIQHKKPKVVIDVHQHLHFYHQYYQVEGFELTTRTSIHHPSYLEAEWYVCGDVERRNTKEDKNK
jgi:hypothetical protein